MATLELTKPADVIATWLAGDGDDNPASPVFTSGEHTEADTRGVQCC